MSSSTSRIEKLNELKKQRLNAVKDNVKLVSSAGGGGGRAEKASSKSTLATTIALERKCRFYAWLADLSYYGKVERMLALAVSSGLGRILCSASQKLHLTLSYLISMQPRN